jgi:DnaA family protein
MLFSPQIPLPLEPPRADRFEEFVVGPNAAALAAVRHLLDEPGGVLFLSGPEGSGKSHLLNALCHAAAARAGRLYVAETVARKPRPSGGPATAGPGVRRRLRPGGGNPIWEQALFLQRRAAAACS